MGIGDIKTMIIYTTVTEYCLLILLNFNPPSLIRFRALYKLQNLTSMSGMPDIRGGNVFRLGCLYNKCDSTIAGIGSVPPSC